MAAADIFIMPANTILILTTARDFHAAAVGTALELLGAHALTYCQSSVVGAGDLTVELGAGREHFRMGTERHAFADIGSVWNRRHPRDFVYPATVHPADKDHIHSAYTGFLRGLGECLTSKFAVNPTAAVMAHANKINQLRVAAHCGLAIPRTIISNCFEDIAAFEGVVGGICVKPLMVYSWLDGQTSYNTYTTRLGRVADDLRPSIELSPMIYQEYVTKAFEARVTIFGSVCVATRIGSQDTAEGAIDWRTTHEYTQHLRTIAAPDQTVSACRKLLNALGLRFGTFDFAVRETGEWVFLEVNQAGQFLWQEEYCPDTPLLEPFARYLQSASDDFNWDPKQASKVLSLASVVKVFQAEGSYDDLLKAPVARSPNEYWDEKEFLKPGSANQFETADATI